MYKWTWWDLGDQALLGNLANWFFACKNSDLANIIEIVRAVAKT